MPPPTDQPAAAAHYLHVTPSFGLGGREIRAVQLIELLGPEVRHTIISLTGGLEAAARIPAAIRVDTPAPPAGTGGFATRWRAIRTFLRARRPDLVLTYNWGAIEWVLAAGWPRLAAVVHHEDGFGRDEAQRLRWHRNLFRRLVLRRAHAVVVPSRRLDEIARGPWGQPAQRVRYLPNGVDLRRFQPGARAAADGVVVFGCVGGVRPEKNQALAVEALARAGCRSRARLRIVGDGPERAAVAALADRLGVADRVDFVGGVDDTAPQYGEMDVFVIPSRTEQMPLSLLEAMASGLPVIGADVGDVRAMLAEPNRVLVVPPLDAAALAAAMDALADDAGRRAELGRANRARVESDFELQRCYGAWLDVYREAARR